MVKYLKDCKVGDNVRIWCIGTMRWDDTVVKVIDNSSIFIKVEYRYPFNRVAEFSQDTKCILV